MTQAKPRFSTFEEYLSYDDGTARRYELIDGELILPPQSEPKDWIANYLFLVLATTRIIPARLIRPHSCEMQVPVLLPLDAANRYPDLVILDETHLNLTKRRFTIKLDMPPPRLVVEILSPGKANQDRNTIRKRAQYAARSIPEYWLIAPETETVTVLQYQNGQYAEVGVFRGSDRIISPLLQNLALTAEQVFEAEFDG